MPNSSIEPSPGPSVESVRPKNDLELYDNEMTSEVVTAMIVFEDTLADFLDTFAQSFEEPNDMTHTAKMKQLVEPLACSFANYAYNLENNPGETRDDRIDHITELALYAEEKRIAIYKQIAFCLDYPKLIYGQARTREDISYCLTESEKAQQQNQKELLLASLASWFSVCIHIELEHTADHMPGR